MRQLRSWLVPLAWSPLLLLVLTHLGGCASSPRLFVNSEADMAYYERVAVMPFDNLSTGRFAGERVTRALVTELIITERYEIVEQGEFRATLERIGGGASVRGDYDPEKLRKAAQQLQATGLIRGAVTDFQMQRSGSDNFPVVSFDVEMLDVDTGKIVWRISTSVKGKGRVPVFGGGSSRTFGKLTQDACKDVVARLEKEAF